MGYFFEDINRPADGGLYAELIVNHRFEEKILPSSYRIVTGHFPDRNRKKCQIGDKRGYPGVLDRREAESDFRQSLCAKAIRDSRAGP